MPWRWPVSERTHVGWHRRAHSALRHSLRLKLIVVFLLLALGLSVIFLGGMQRAIGAGWRLAVQPLVADYVDRLVADIGSPPSVARARALTERLPISVQIQGPVVQWRSHDETDARGWMHDDPAWRDDVPRLFDRDTADGHRIRFGMGDLPWERQPRLVGWFTVLMLLVVVALAYAYLRRLLRPLDDIRGGVQRYGKGEFDRAIAVRRQDELGDLAQQINTMAHDLQQMLDGKRALLLAISHELRSPLTRARINAELLPESGDALASRNALLRDLAEMRDLINDLLEGERLSGSHVALHREPTDLCALVQGLVQERALAEAVTLELPQGLPAIGVDATRVRLAVRNLLDNAVRHGAAATLPRVSVRRDGQCLQVIVRDHGPGVDPAHLAHLGEAFYRTDIARQRVTGGVGLGLHLARLVAKAHGGSLTFRNAAPGLEAILVLPMQA
ncbi:MAG: HAMP domain-containing histidine kinase [Rhodoferax sp.]|nr:HAMP domain-containing histidine kinase [Rhodoferax sp.]